MPTKTSKESKLVTWSKHCLPDRFGADTFEANFPLLYGTSISISTFPEKKVLDIGEVLQEERQRNTYLACADNGNHRRIYAVPNSKANARLSLQCCFEFDSVNWEANSAYFNNGNLIAIVSNFSLTDSPKGLDLATLREDIYHDSKTLKDIYKQEVDRVAREIMGYKERQNPIVEMVRIIKADSPKGKGLNEFYRDAIREVLTI